MSYYDSRNVFHQASLAKSKEPHGRLGLDSLAQSKPAADEVSHQLKRQDRNYEPGTETATF